MSERLSELQAEADDAIPIIEELQAVIDKHSAWLVLVAMCKLVGHGLAQAPDPNVEVGLGLLAPHIVLQFKASCEQRQVPDGLEMIGPHTAVN